MLRKLVEIIRPFLLVAAVFLLLQVTGLWGPVSGFAQSAVLQTGFLDANNVTAKDPDTFNYDFIIKDIDDNRISFTQYKGKVIFLNLWATWCGPCRAEMSAIQKLYDTVDKDKIVFVMLSLDKDQDKAKIVDYIAKKSYTFPVFQPSGGLSSQLNVPSIPTTFIVSKDGKIVSKEVGATNFNTARFKKFITDLTQ